jgi:hypothetical protein
MKDQRTLSYLLSKKMNESDVAKISGASATNAWSFGLTYQSGKDFDKTDDSCTD